MKKIALKIAYIGTHFHGFQRQPNLRTVEGEIICALKELGYIEDLKQSKFAIAGRTDRGVHSLGNVISFMSEKEVLINQINHKLPDDIRVLGKAPVRYGFKPRYASKRYYRYMLFEEDLDISAINDLAKLFIGKHDFTNFSKRDQKTPVRTIDNINIIIPNEKKDNNSIKYKPIAGKFNRYMFSHNELGITDTHQNDENILNLYNEYEKNTKKTNSDENLLKAQNEHEINQKKINNEENLQKAQNEHEINQKGMDYFDSIFIDVYGESFLWNMIRKMMRIFLLVGKNQMQIDEVKKFFNPQEKFNIKPLESENLILMDTTYNNINFKYDEYACKKFKKYLIENLFNYKMSYSIENNILNSMDNLIKTSNYRK